MNKRMVGSQKENIAAQYLKENGLVIKTQNYRNRFGEIDIIATEKDVLVFVEVKYRKTASVGHPEEAVDYRKSRTISKVSDYYRMVNHVLPDTQFRFDVVAIEGDEIRWYKNAFSYVY